eukprot:31461-Eustigmatos_ZCMA.PRE.1
MANAGGQVVQELAREAGVAEDRAKGHMEQLSGWAQGDQACCEALWVDKYRPRGSARRGTRTGDVAGGVGEDAALG